MRKPSLYSDEPVCFLCQSNVVHRHHIYPGCGRREVSEQEGCWVYLCPRHHNMSNQGIHLDREFDRRMREDCQRRWEEREGLEGEEAHDEFRKLFGVSYL